MKNSSEIAAQSSQTESCWSGIKRPANLVVHFTSICWFHIKSVTHKPVLYKREKIFRECKIILLKCKFSFFGAKKVLSGEWEKSRSQLEMQRCLIYCEIASISIVSVSVVSRFSRSDFIKFNLVTSIRNLKLSLNSRDYVRRVLENWIKLIQQSAYELCLWHRWIASNNSIASKTRMFSSFLRWDFKLNFLRSANRVSKSRKKSMEFDRTIELLRM